MSKVMGAENPLVKICLKVIEWGTYILLFTPLIVGVNFYFPFVAPKSLFFMGVTEIIFAFWLILIFHCKKYQPKINIVLVALVLFLICMTISSIFGVNFSNSFWSKLERMSGLLMHLHLFAFFLVISSVFKEKKDWNKIFALSVMVGLAVSLISFVAKMNPDAFVFAAKGGATLGNSSFLGTYLLFNSFFAIYLLFHGEKKCKILAGVSVVLMVISMAINGARAATASFFGGIALIGLLYLIFVSKKKWMKMAGKCFLIFSVVLGIIIASFVFKNDSPIQKKFIELTTKSRLIVWDKAWDGIQEKPLLGWGPENFDLVFTKYYNPCMILPECGGEIWFDRAHNIVFDILVSMGIIGFIAYLFLLGSVPISLFRNYLKNKDSTIGFWIPAIFTSLVIAYFIQNLTVFDMISSYLMIFLVLGFVASLEKKEGEVVCSETNPFVITFVFIGLVVCFTYYVIGPMKTGREVIKAIASKTSEERIIHYGDSLKASPVGKYQIRDFFGQQILERIRLSKEKINPDQLKKELDFLINALEKTREENPLDFRSILKLGQLYGQYSFIDPSKISMAEERLAEAIKISPTNQQGYWEMAQIKAFQKKYDEALKFAEKSVELEPRVFDSHSICIQIAIAMKNKDIVNQKIAEALKVNPEWEKSIKQILVSRGYQITN